MYGLVELKSEFFILNLQLLFLLLCIFQLCLKIYDALLNFIMSVESKRELPGSRLEAKRSEPVIIRLPGLGTGALLTAT